jgi:16S rRNA pseudouridine516 synthase
MSDNMRLDKLLVECKYGSRKEVQKFIRRGYVFVNGSQIIKPDTKVSPETDEIIFDDELVYFKSKIVLMMNKPKGYVCANKDGLHKTVFELINEPYDRFDLKIAGRLDIDTEGLILLTNDGQYIHSIISPNKDVFKKYYVETKDDFDAKQLLNPMSILDGKNCHYTPMTPKVEQLSDHSFYLYIQEGKFHQVKRMVAHFDNEVTYLKRIAIGDIELDSKLALGEYKEIG